MLMARKAASGKELFLAGDDELLLLERECREEGFYFIAGVDEVGRGPLAGPVVAAAVMFEDWTKIPRMVFDSKALSDAARRELRAAIMATPQVAVGLGVVEVDDIDRLNILNATHLAMKLALEQLPKLPDIALVDGNRVKTLPCPSRSFVKGDGRSASIAAASIVAKVYRDDLMALLDQNYPGYGFGSHKGYGTAEHLAALISMGPCPEHRRSFAPVRNVLARVEQPDLFGE